MIEKQHLRAVFLYMCEAERCPASLRDREPGSWNFSRGGEKNIPDHSERQTNTCEDPGATPFFVVLVSVQTIDYKRGNERGTCMASTMDDAWLQRQKEFVLNSELISGRGFKEGGEKEFWERPEVKAHLEMAKILNQPECKLVDVWLINAGLMNERGDCIRTGVPGLSKGMVPESEDIPAFIESFNEKIRAGLEHYKHASDGEKDTCAWRAHDEVFCAAIFKDGNSRTARLLYNHVRTVFGLDTFVIRYDKSKEYYANVQNYRHGTFLPMLRAMQDAA